MKEENSATQIFEDAWGLYAEALKDLDAGRLRNAAEKAWGATKRATDAFILARTGEEPRTAGQTARGLRQLEREDQRVTRLVGPYFTRASFLHGSCFYDGMCEPEEAVERDIRETDGYIREAQKLARANDF
jgi:hypothetical protein